MQGAAEWVLERCTGQYDASGNVVPLPEAAKKELLDLVTEMAGRGLRCICLTTGEIPLQAPGRCDRGGVGMGERAIRRETSSTATTDPNRLVMSMSSTSTLDSVVMLAGDDGTPGLTWIAGRNPRSHAW